MKRHLGALLSVASMGGGELMKFSLEPSYDGGGNASNYKKRRGGNSKKVNEKLKKVLHLV